MSDKQPNITIPIDLTNPGQFFACCGLLELADRLWPGAEGWFAANVFLLSTGEENCSVLALCEAVIECAFSTLLPVDELDLLTQLNQKKAELKKASKSLAKSDESRRKSLNSKRIASGFRLGPPFELRVDWWLIERCDADHLKTWAGQQAVAGVAESIKDTLVVAAEGDIFDVEKVIVREDDGKAVAPLSFDSGRVGTAQDIGYSPDKVGQAIACCVWTEFLTLIALQRFAVTPDDNDSFAYHIWRVPLEVSVAALAARGAFPNMVTAECTFRLAARDSGNRYKAFQQATLTHWRST